MTASSLSIDKDLRDRASKRAKEDSLTISAVARMLLRDYADGHITLGARVATPESYHISSVETDPSTQALMEDVFAAWSRKQGSKWN